MNNLFEFIYSKADNTIRIQNNNVKIRRNEELLAQVEGVNDAKDVVNMITKLRPDIKVIDSALYEVEV